MPFTKSTSSSSFTLPCTTTPEHALQPEQHDLLQEHSVHHEPLLALPVDKQRFSRIKDHPGDPYQLYNVQAKVGEEDHRALATEEVEEFREIGTAGVPDSKISETSHFQSQMHFDDSVERFCRF